MSLYVMWYTNEQGERKHVDIKAETEAEALKKFSVMKLPGFEQQLYCLPIPKGI